MYNTLALIALVPLAGPDAGDYLAAMPKPAVIRPVNDSTEAPTEWPRRTVHLAARTTEADQRRPAGAVPRASVTPAPPVVTAPTPSATATPATLPETTERTTFAQARDPKVVRTNGALEIPKRNKVPLAASNQAVIHSLRTQQLDAEGKPALDESGRPVMIPVYEGMPVRRGQVLGGLDDRELNSKLQTARTELDVAVAAMEKDIEIEYAARGVQHETSKLNMLLATNKQHAGAVSPMEIKIAEFEVLKAEANLDLQKYAINVERTAETEVCRERINEINVLIGLRKFVSPIDGMISKIERAEGEWLREGDVVYEIIQLNVLRVKCAVNAKHYTAEEVSGKNATITVPMVDGRTMDFPGKVVFVDPQVSLSSDEFDVYVELQNRASGRSWLLQPGRRVSVQIHL